MDYEEPRSVCVSLMLDANAINARQADEDLNQIDRWRSAGVLDVIMSEPSSLEARAGNDPTRAAKAIGHIYSYIGATTDEEEAVREKIGTIIFPDGPRTDGERNDVEIVFQARKYKRILVTNDGGSRRQPRGILGSRGDLDALGLSVRRPSEVVALVREKISERDQRARELADLKGTPVPDWVGKD